MYKSIKKQQPRERRTRHTGCENASSVLRTFAWTSSRRRCCVPALVAFVLVLLTGSFGFSLFAQELRISYVEKPTICNEKNVVQHSCRRSGEELLQPFCYKKLPVGAVSPKGWLEVVFQRQQDGLCGRLDELSPWLDKSQSSWLHPDNRLGWEELPYWLRAYASMAFISEDETMLRKAMPWIEAILASQDEDGWFGPKTQDSEYQDIWPNMIVLQLLQDYYEYSNDRRVLELMKKYFRYLLAFPETKLLKGYWERFRHGDNIQSVLWYYDRTGDADVLPLVRKLHLCGADWKLLSDLPTWHNVNVASGFREPAMFFLFSGKPEDLRAAYDNFYLIRRTFGQVPGGMFCSDENCRQGYIDPRQGVEICGIVEQMFSNQLMFRLTGDQLWIENTEDVFFNSFHAAFMPDMRSLRYITCPNHVISDRFNHAPGIASRGPFFVMNPLSYRCCQHNHGFALPYHIQNLWLATPDHGLAAAFYGPCFVRTRIGNDAREIEIHEETNYPFDETIRLTLKMSDSAKFPLYLRIPSWTRKGVELKINGSLIELPENRPGTFLKIERSWSHGDRIFLSVPREISIRTWQVNRNSVSVDYGPLTFSLKIKERYDKVSGSMTAITDSRWLENADEEKWPAWEIYPESPWNYGLMLDRNNLANSFEIIRTPWPEDGYPFEAETTPLRIKAWGRRIPDWKIDRYGLCGLLPSDPVWTPEPVEEIQLIPMGAARLRISAFPEVQ